MSETGRAQSAVVCRLAGDEFCIFFYGCSAKKEIRHYIERLQVRLETYNDSVTGKPELLHLYFRWNAWYPEDGQVVKNYWNRQIKQCIQ